MAESGMDLDGGSPAHDSWSHDNDRGLAHAADGEWTQAVEAFEAAVDALVCDMPMRPATHEPLALVTGNLAHACFRAGRSAEALQHAQRNCALRVAIAGEDGMPVARARMDLAVILAAAGRGEEAMALVQRAIAAIEHRVGDEDVRLAIVLENAARISLALGNAANAEPLLLRLHALLDAHELSTGRADKLLARVAEVRARRRHTPVSRTPIAQPVVHVAADRAAAAPVRDVMSAARLNLDDLQGMEAAALDDSFGPNGFSATIGLTTPDSSSVLAPREYAHASIDEGAPWEDQPLRDAVAMTDILLRTTPTGISIIPVSAPLEPPTVSESSASDADDAGLQLAPNWSTVAAAPIETPPAAARQAVPSRLSDRAQTIVMPTPHRGVRAMETPSRSPRAESRENARQPHARHDAPQGGGAVSDNRAAKSESTSSSRSSDLPMIVGLAAATAAAGGALWWFLLR